MKNNSPKQIALKALIKHKCYSLNNCDDLKRIIESNQFTIIEYKKHANLESVSELISKLNLQREIEQNDSFLYIKNNLKFVFLNSSVSDEDKCSLLRHELGHICDPRFRSGDAGYSPIQKEEFANEFSGYTKNSGIHFMLCIFLATNRKLLLGILTMTVLLSGFAFVFDNLTNPQSEPASVTSLSDSICFITSSGKKYHRKDCIIIKYKNNLTEIILNDAADNGYEPCKICNPES